MTADTDSSANSELGKSSVAERHVPVVGIGRTNVYQLMDEGRVRSVRIGQRRLIPRAALEEFVVELLEAS